MQRSNDDRAVHAMILDSPSPTVIRLLGVNRADLIEVLQSINLDFLTELEIDDSLKLISLRGCPKQIDHFACYSSSITTLEHGPKIAKTYSCSLNKNLASLKGAPDKVKRFYCSDTNITSLQYCPQEAFSFQCCNNPQLILRNVWKHLHRCKTYKQTGHIHKESGLLGLLRIKDLNQIRLRGLDMIGSPSIQMSIVSKYVPLKTMSDIIHCKHKLITAGFKSNARF